MRYLVIFFCLFSLVLGSCSRQVDWAQTGPLVWEEKIAPAPLPQIPEPKRPELKEIEPKIAVPQEIELKKSEPPAPVCVKKQLETIVLDAGHGGKDAGTESEKNHYQEKALTLLTTRLVQKYLEEMGYVVHLTRDTDVFIELNDRAHFANNHKADLFVSIHYNFCQSPEVEGIEIFYHKGDKNFPSPRQAASKKLGEEVLFRIVKHTGSRSRGIKTANFAVIRETKMPAILIEGGFLSNSQEREKIKDSTYRCYLAYAIARGVDAYLAALR